MKKKYLLGILFSALSLFFLSACNSPSKIKVEFSQESYTLSIDGRVDFFDELKITGIEKEEVTLISTKPEVICQDGEDFVARQSGNTYILAKYNQRVLAQAKVYVKYKYSQPQNVSISSTGLMTWDESYFMKEDGSMMTAPKYSISYKLAGSAGKAVTVTSSKNSYQLNVDKGAYEVELQAISQNTDYDSSTTFTGYVNYGVMGYLEDVQISSSPSTTSTTLTWKEKVNARYDVYVEGFNVATNLNVNSFTHNFSVYNNLQKINVCVVAKTASNNNSASTDTLIVLNNLEKPQLTYENGVVSISENAKASGYVLQDESDAGNIISLGRSSQTWLEGKNSDIYSFKGRALGDNGKCKLVKAGEYSATLSSGFSDTITVAKLEKPKYDFTMTEDGLTLTFEDNQTEADDSVIVKYLVKYGNQTKTVSSKDNTATIDFSSFSAGQINFTIQTIPAVESVFTQGEISTTNCIKSDVVTFSVYKPANFGTLSHNLDGKTSTLTFDCVNWANAYQLYINDVITDVDFTLVDEDGDGKDDKVKFVIENLSTYLSQDDKYTFTVKAFRTDGDKVVSTTVASNPLDVAILDVVEKADAQQNGFYSWTEVENAKYYYEIYQTNKDGVITNQTPVQANETTQLQTLNALPFGYYKIYIYSKAIDDLHLDCNFEDDDRCWQDDFIVTEDIVASDVTFEERDGNYILKITLSEYAGKYEISVDGSVDGSKVLVSPQWLEGQDVVVEYTMLNNFAQEKDYTLSIVAKGGTLYDETLHLPSSATTLTVTRVAKPQGDVELTYDAFGRLEHQYLNIEKVVGSSALVATRGGTALTVESRPGNYRIDMPNNEFGDEFQISLTAKAQASEEGHYYLDSHENVLSFKRLISPSNPSFSDNMFSYQLNDEGAEKLLITISIFKNDVCDYLSAFQVNKEIASLNVEAKIQELANSNNAFKSAYNSMDYLTLAVQSLASGEDEGVHLLPSAQSSSVRVGKTQSVTLAFNQSIQTLSWQALDNGKYDLYVDDVCVLENLTSNSIKLSDVSALDLTQEKTFAVASRQSNALQSQKSNEIKIKQLPAPTKVDISKQGSNFVMNVNVTTSNAISGVEVNGSAINYTPLASTASANIASQGAKEVKLIAKTGAVDGVYYLNSSVAKFTIEEIGNVNLVKNGDTISWNNPSLNKLLRNSANPYKVEMTLIDTNGDLQKTIDVTDLSSLSIKEIETLFNVDLNNQTQDFVLQAKMVFGGGYSLDISQEGAVGLYGEKQSSASPAIYKLNSIENIQIHFEDKASASDYVSAKLNGNVAFTFDNLWEDFSGVTFVIKIGDIPINISAVTATVPGLYSLKLQGDAWILAVPAMHFVAKNNQVQAFVSANGQVDSDETTVSVSRFDKVDSMTLSQEGILKITDDQQASYALTLVHADGVKSALLQKTDIEEIDFTSSDWLGAFGKGDYTIKVVAFDEEGKILPSATELTYQAHQYEGILNVALNEEGKIIFTMGSDGYADAIFTARLVIDGKTYDATFTPSQPDQPDVGAELTYWLTMKQAVDLFKDHLSNDSLNEYRTYAMSFTVRSEGGINAGWKDVSFEYKGENAEDFVPMRKRASMDEDYIVFAMDSNVTTTSIFAGFTATWTELDEEGQAITNVVKGEQTYSSLATPLNSIYGFWIENQTGVGRFSPVNDAIGGESVIECYAININQLLADVECGSYVIETYKTVIDANDNHVQYSPVTFDGYKLTKVHDEDDGSENIVLSIDRGYLLQWQFVAKDISQQAKTPDNYYVVVSDGQDTRKFLTNVTVYDLRTCALDVNKTYEVCVQAVNSDETILASSYSIALKVVQYATTANPTESNGSLGFNLLPTTTIAGTMFNHIKESLGTPSAQDYQTTIESVERYASPFSFLLQDIAKAKVRIKFVEITTEGAEGKVYYLTLPAIDLLLDFEIDGYSYFELLENYLSQVTNEDVKSFIEAILASKRGLGTGEYLFDDEGAQIPKGVYVVTFVQISNEDIDDVNFIESAPSTAYRIYLSAGASISLNQEEFEGKEFQHTMMIQPNKTATTDDGETYTEVTALEYRMLMRGRTIEQSYVIDFAFDSATSTWSGTFRSKDINSTDVGVVLITLSQTTPDGVNFFKVNMSALRDVLDLILAEEDLFFEVGTSYNVDVYTLSNGNQGVLNGKSGEFILTYQDFDVANMSLDNGTIILSSTSAGNLLVRYAYQTQAGVIEVVSLPIEKGENRIDLSCIADDGVQLEFISLSLQGNYTYNTMNVESKIYGIYAPYKLSKPTVTSTNNNFAITYSANDLATGVIDNMDGYITYVVENNQGGKATPTTNKNRVDYQVGLYEEERNASEFYVYLQGNKGRFQKLTSEDEYYQTSQYYDYQLVLAEGGNLLFNQNSVLKKVILKSEIQSIKAKMLNFGKEDAEVFYRVSEGNIYFNLPLAYTENIKDDEGESAEIIYKVDLKYYDNYDLGANSTYVSTETLYLTTENVIDGELYLDGQLVNRVRDLVSFDVTALVAKPLDTQDANSLTTINGRYFTIVNSFTNEDGDIMLRSTTMLTEDENGEVKFSHPKAVEIPTKTGLLLIRDGVIRVVTDSHIGLTELPQTLEDHKVVALIKDSTGAIIRMPGTVTVALEEGVDGRLAVIKPDDFAGTALDPLKGSYFELIIMTYSEGQLISLPLSIQNIYKLPALEDGYEIKVQEKVIDGVVGYSTYIDFAKYFNFKVDGKNDFYQIKLQVEYTEGESAIVMLSKDKTIFEFTSNVKSVTIQAIDAQSFDTSNRIKLFHSDVLKLNVKTTNYDNANIAWNDEIKGFTWSGGTEGQQYEYYYKAVVSGVIESGITTNAFYLTENMGNVTSFLIQARNTSLFDEEGERIIHMFSKAIEADATQLNKGINIFAGGNGSKSKPYLIKTVVNATTGAVEKSALEQFNSIALRNNTGVYFKLMENLELILGTNYTPIDNFKGHLIGDKDVKLTIKANAVFDLDAEYSISVANGVSYKFNQHSSLFKQMAPDASIENLAVDYSFNFNQLSSSKILYAPLVARNYGVISDVVISNFSVSALGGNGSNNVFMAGLAGFNFGTIINCQNASQFAYETTQGLDVTLGYGGIVCVNSSSNYSGSTYRGTLFNCTNLGRASISITANNLAVYLGGVSLHNNATIIACGNQAELKAEGRASYKGDYHISGLVNYNNGGLVSSCYNNGKLTASNYLTAQIAGICNNLTSGTIKSVVETYGFDFATTWGSPNISSCYATASAQIPSQYTSKIQQLTGNQNFSLEEVVSVNGGQYNVYLKMSTTVSGAYYTYTPALTVELK